MKTFSDRHSANLQRYSVQGQTMGTHYSAVFFAESSIDMTAIRAQLFSAVSSVDQQMSNWNAESDLNQLNRAPVNEWVSVPAQMAEVISAALHIGRHSNGAFDIGVGELTQCWGFGPSQGEMNLARLRQLKRADYKSTNDLLDVNLQQGRIRKKAATTLDLSGIAKGYGVDLLARCLESMGIEHYLVGIDGEMRAGGTKPGNRPWSIAIEKPVRQRREAMGIIELTDAAIATSGDYRHWVEHQGQTYSHIMDARQQAPKHSKLAAVTVVASSCMLADAWATALFVLDENEGVRLAQSRHIEALFILRDGEKFRQIYVLEGRIEPL